MFQPNPIGFDKNFKFQVAHDDFEVNYTGGSGNRSSTKKASIIDDLEKR